MRSSGATAIPLGPGDEIGGHRLLRRIGEGGMGVVYLAEHKLIGRKAAIKVLLPEYSSHAELTSRFFNEARAATSIRHPGIVEIYDFGHRADGSAYIIMELLEGESLEGRIRRLGKVSLGNALFATRQIASALAAAHARGIVHRDLKPDNIFLVPDRDMASGERTKVLDFGIAKLSETDDASGTRKTRTGMLMGTPAYMAPEQCRGAGGVDHAADLYALGCIVYEMLCGRTPFAAEGAGELMAMHMYEQPQPVSALNPEIPPAVDEFVTRLLAKEPTRRQASAEQVIVEVDALAAALGALPSPMEGLGDAPSVPGALGMPTPHGRVGGTTSLPGYISSLSTRSQAGVGAASTVASPSSGLRKYGVAIAAVALIAVIGVGAGLATRGGSSSASNEDASETPAPAEPLATAKAPEPTAPATAPPPRPAAKLVETKPAKVSIVIESSPVGASVFLEPDGVRLGVTPHTHQIEPRDGRLSFTVVKDGFLKRSLDVLGNADSHESVVLRPKPPVRLTRRPPKRHKRNKTSSRASSKTKTKSNPTNPGRKSSAASETPPKSILNNRLDPFGKNK